MLKRNVPNIITMSNLFLGFFAIVLASSDQTSYVEYAAIAVIFGAVLDALDGRLARLFNVQNDFGKELDSLSDIVTFGVAPSFIVFTVSLQQMGVWGIAAAGVFPVFGALRLARFNTAPVGVSEFFVGMPITAAGGILATISLYHDFFSKYATLSAVVLLSFLMVSKMKYPSFKKKGLSKKIFFLIPILVMSIIALLIKFNKPIIIFLPLFLYILYGIVYNIYTTVKKDKLPIPAETEIDETDEK